MKKYIILILLAWTGLTFAIEESLPRPEKTMSADELQSTIDKLNQEKKTSEDYLAGLEKVRDKATIEKERERIKLIDYGLTKAKTFELQTTAGSQRVKEREGTNFDQYKENLEKQLPQLETELKTQIETTQKSLTSEMKAAPSLSQINEGLSTALDTINETFYTRPADTSSVEYLGKIADLQSIVNNATNVQRLVNEARNSDTPDKKVEVFANSRNKLTELRRTIDAELATTIDEKYKQQLNKFKNSINSRLVEIDRNTLEQSGISDKNQSFWIRLVNRVKSAVSSLRQIFASPRATHLQLVNEMMGIKKDLGPTIQLINTIDDMTYETAELVKRAKAEGITNFSDQLRTAADTLRNLEKKISPADQQAVTESYARLQGLTGDLQGYVNRYKESFPTLFDRLLDDYQFLFETDPTFGINQAYEKLGLSRNATQKEVENVREVVSKLDINQFPENKAKRNAAYLLANPVSRQTYDAFLKDYELNTKELNRIEIDKNQRDDFLIVASDISAATMEAGTLRGPLGVQFGLEEAQFPPIFTRIGDVTKQIDDLLSQ